MRKTRAVWHLPWTEVDTLGPARPTLTSYPVSVLGVSRVWGLGRVEGEGGGTNVCKLRDANSPFSLQARVSRWNVSRQHCKVQAARGMPARLPRAFARSGPGSLAPSLSPRAGVPGGGAPKWLSFLERAFPGRPSPGSRSQVLPSLGDAGGVQPVPWLLQQAPPEAAGKAAGLGQQTPYPPLV